jgi:intein/homing endonuclease
MKIPFLSKKEKSIPELEIKSEEIKLQDIIAPASVEIRQNYLRLGERFCKTFFVFSYPRYLSTGWLSPAINLNHPLDISLHIHPVDSGMVLKQLVKKLTEVQAELAERAEKGLVRDPTLETAYQDIEKLRDELQTARERVFRLGVYITIYGDTEKELRQVETILRSIFESRLIYLKPTLMRERQGFVSTSPYGLDQILVHTPMNTAPLSSIFPFVSPDLSANEGILYGINQHNNSLVLFDRFTLENANMVIFAKSGSGKSLVGSEPVLIKNQKGEIQLTKIGPLIEKIIKKQGIDFYDKELEGKTFPGIYVWTFDKNLKGKWGKVKIAARKKAPKVFYKFKTKSGREITTTGDHNLVILKNGKIEVVKGSEAKEGEFIPLSRRVSPEKKSSPRFLNLLSLLRNSENIYIKGGKKIIQENYKLLKRIKINPRLDRYLYKYRDDRLIPIKYFWQIKERLKINLSKEISSLSLVSHKGKGEIPSLLKITPELLKILGYISSEGTITKKSIIISNLDKETIKDIETSLKKLNILYFKPKDKRSINITTTCFVETIKALQGGEKSGEKRVYSFIFNLKKDQIAQYLAAYFEGDGGVENKEISVISKSKRLISEISYLLLYFGIIGRISKAKKKAVNCNWKRKKTYWKISISGQDNLRKFAKHINFISKRKKCQLTRIIKKNGNTNVDLIPEIKSIFEEIYQLFGCQLHRIQDISDLKRGHYNPSPEKLREIIPIIEERIQRFKNLASTFRILSELPSLIEIIDLGKSKKELNRKLWQTLGHSWRVMKKEEVKPRITNVFRVIETISGNSFEPRKIKNILHLGFREMDLPIKYFNRSLQPALKTRFLSNTRYEMVQEAARYVWQNYQDILINKIPKVEEKLDQLKILANSDLFWDPIVEIKKIKNKKEKKKKNMSMI